MSPPTWVAFMMMRPRIEVLGFRVLAPQEEAAREAARRAVAKGFYKSRPDGSRIEVDPLGR
ncbi:hypothetical protein ACLMAL_07815 [Nocardia sp. CWNU-33]|uniref:hypothetical protein n=1 Tax=Nocardia sp. CWNU-33 TaxID=3392117 RepID=UPI00398E4AEA